MSRAVDNFEYQLEVVDNTWYARGQGSELVGETGLVPLASARVIDDAAGYAAILDKRLTDREVAARIGDRLFTWLFPGEVGTAFLRAWSLATRDRKLLRLLLRYPSTDRRLHAIPWELLYAKGETLSDFLALNPDILLARCVRQLQPRRPIQVEGPIRVLHTSACPPGRTPLDLRAERECIETTLRKHAAVAECQVADHVSLAGLRGELTRPGQPVHIWHHSGHGEIVKDPLEFSLILEREGREEAVRTCEIVRLVQASPELRLVVVNTCQGANPYGLVPALAALNVPAVLGYRAPVLDAVALRFTQTLYDELLTRPIDQAVWEARRSVLGTNRPFDWALPVLFLRTPSPTFAPAYRGSELDVGYEVPKSVTAPETPPPPSPPPSRPAPANRFGGGSRINVKISGSKTGNVTAVGKLDATGASSRGSGHTSDISVDISNSTVGNVHAFEEVIIPPDQLAEFFQYLRESPEPPPVD